MRCLAIALAAALVALPAAAQQSSQPSPSAPGVPTSPHQTDVLRQHPSGAQTGTPGTTAPTAGGGAAPGSPHQSQVLRGPGQQDRSSEPSGGRLPETPRR